MDKSTPTNTTAPTDPPTPEFLEQHMAARKRVSDEYWDAEDTFDRQCRVRDREVARLLGVA